MVTLPSTRPAPPRRRWWRLWSKTTAPAHSAASTAPRASPSTAPAASSTPSISTGARGCRGEGQALSKGRGQCAAPGGASPALFNVCSLKSMACEPRGRRPPPPIHALCRAAARAPFPPTPLARRAAARPPPPLSPDPCPRPHSPRQHFYVVGMGYGPWSPDMVGGPEYNLKNPIRRDTATLLFTPSGDQPGWIALRFKTNTPGGLGRGRGWRACVVGGALCCLRAPAARGPPEPRCAPHASRPLAPGPGCGMEAGLGAAG
jgi:hypothetical protein